jgi:hypothetical protein
MSQRQGALAEVAGLARTVGAALGEIPGWLWGPSVAGWPRLKWPAPFSEYGLFVSPDVSRTIRFLVDVLVPSLPSRAPGWVPEPARSIFFHRTSIIDRAGHGGDAHPREHWFFINGILTDPGMAGRNADYLAEIFGRPVTIIQNATDGPIFDLAECAEEKAFGMNGEPVDLGFPHVHEALRDPATDLVVIVAHSQGTLIASVMLRLLRLIYAPDGKGRPTGQQLENELAALRRTGVTLDPGDFEDITATELVKLEVYCFANCATVMRYVDPRRRLPWIESFGNAHDLVAGLGMLAPDPLSEGVAIDGPLWRRRSAWGHLLNIHYLRAIDVRQRRGGTPGPATDTSAPYEPLQNVVAAQPKLYGYINGATPPPNRAKSGARRAATTAPASE